MTKVGVIGASGFAGAELLRLAASHPSLEVVFATGDSQAGTKVGDLYPHLYAAYPDLVFEPYSPDLVDGLDVVVLGLPHGVSGGIVPEIADRVGTIVDLAADFRLTDAGVYEQWYGAAHPHPELLGTFAYGLPELFRDGLADATRIALPGCYPTAAALALAPLVRLGLVEPTGIVVDAASGLTGAGRGLKHTTQFATADEDFTAYGLVSHRHTPEMEQAIGAQLLFTPHLAPMNRGILATCYARPTGETSTAVLLDALAGFYADEPFVVVREAPPSTKATTGSNTCHVSARFDERTGTVIVLSALDNLVKGTSGQAIQVLNLLAGDDETLGLPLVGVAP
ncbi:MAG: N-acetyl-gamma-glutamyl-phosphate reductase [Actinomycetota bacterium]